MLLLSVPSSASVPTARLHLSSSGIPYHRPDSMPASIGPIPLPEHGQKASGHFTFDDPQLNLGKYEWPYFAVVGAHAGPTFLLTAGIHAAEYTGILAAIRLGRWLQPAELHGTVVVIPLLNRPGFFERSIYVN